MVSRSRARVLVAVVAILTTMGTSAHAGVLTDASIGPDPEGGGEVIRLVFEGSVPDVEVTAYAWGIALALPGTSMDIDATAPFRVLPQEGATVLRLDRPGTGLRSLRLEGNVVTITTNKPAVEASRADYLLGVGDVVAIKVYKDPDLSGSYTVSQLGTITLPLIGSVPAAGATETELASLVRKRLGEFLVDPQVVVSVESYRSQFVYVAGAVERAARVALQPGMNLKDVLSIAGVTLHPGQEMELVTAGGSGESITLTWSRLDDLDGPVPHDGDLIWLEEPAYIFVQGEVRRPGKQTFTPGLTLMQAITVSEGFTDWANKKEVRIMRRTEAGTFDEVVNIKEIEDLTVPDPELQPGDHILIKRRIL